MSAVTFITATHTDTLRHYGKLAGLGYSQDMENHLPRPAAHGDAMDTSLDHNQFSDHPPIATAEVQHALPVKPPLVHDPLPATSITGAVEEAAESLSPMGKILASAFACLTLTKGS